MNFPAAYFRAKPTILLAENVQLFLIRLGNFKQELSVLAFAKIEIADETKICYIKF